MILKYPILLVSFFVLALLQHSFFVHFNILGVTPSVIFILFFIIIFFEKPQEYSLGMYFAIVAGFFTDAFSPFNFGTSIICFLITYIVFKITSQFFKETHEKYLFFYFIPRFLCFFVGYELLYYVATHFYQVQITFSPSIFVSLAYNTMVAMALCYAYKTLALGHKRQLKLL